MQGSGKLPTKYSVGVCRDLEYYGPNIHLVNAGSGGFLAEYSFGECRGQADF